MTAYLAELRLGTLTLSPAFDRTVNSYTATTTDGTNRITAEAEDGSASVEIKLGEVAKQNGASLRWEEGENVVTVAVTNGPARETYTIIVTKS